MVWFKKPRNPSDQSGLTVPILWDSSSQSPAPQNQAQAHLILYSCFTVLTLEMNGNTKLSSLHLLLSKNKLFQDPRNLTFALQVTWEFLDASVIKSFSPEDWISAFSELFMEFSIEDCEFCSSEVSETSRNNFKQTNESFQQELSRMSSHQQHPQHTHYTHTVSINENTHNKCTNMVNLSSNSRITTWLLPELFLPTAGAQTLGSDPRGSQAPAQPHTGCPSPQQTSLDCKGIPSNQKQKGWIVTTNGSKNLW